MSPVKIEYGWFLFSYWFLGMCRCFTRKRMEFPPCAQGNIGKKEKQLRFLLCIKNEVFVAFAYCLDSSVSRATFLKFNWTVSSSNCVSDKHFFFFIFIFLYLEMLLLYENIINLIIFETLKVLFSTWYFIERIFYNEMWTR